MQPDPRDQSPPPRPPDRSDLLDASDRRLTMLLRIVRGTFLVLLGTVVLLTILQVDPQSGSLAISLALTWQVTVFVAVLLATVVVAIDVLTPRKKIATLSGVFFGLLAAMLATVALGFVIELIATTYAIQDAELIATAKVIVGICLSYLAITTVLQTQDDFRLVIPYVEFAKEVRGMQPLILDTSTLIDARIVDLANTGMVQAPMVIPTFVVGELQQLSDSGDKLKRQRGRRGLDVVNKLQRDGNLDVTIDDTPTPGKAVDQMLVHLAKSMSGIIVTGDTGLARVANIHSVSVVNLHEVANALKPSVLPGEHLNLKLMKAGEQDGQAVGYLDDGTMVVVEHATEWIGIAVNLEVTSSMQTSAGRLIFAKVENNEETEKLFNEEPANNDPSTNNAPSNPDPTPHTKIPQQSPTKRPITGRNPRR